MNEYYIAGLMNSNKRVDIEYYVNGLKDEYGYDHNLYSYELNKLMVNVEVAKNDHLKLLSIMSVIQLIKDKGGLKLCQYQ